MNNCLTQRRAKKILRVGCVVGDQLERSVLSRQKRFIGGSGLVRYAWMGSYFNQNPQFGIRYDIYSRMKRFDMLMFIKSMGGQSIKLLANWREKGKPAVFDANVNYYERTGTEYYEGMLPTQKQTDDAVAMTKNSDGVIADSEFIMERAGKFNKNVEWIPDNVRMDIAPKRRPWRRTGRLPLLWSGVSLKLFELLSIENTLRKYANHIELTLITNGLADLDRWFPEYKKKFMALLNAVPHRFIRYESIEAMNDIYAMGGIFISPRYLDNSYNLGHTEWKITLALACSRMVFCAPAPSYKIVHQRANGEAVRICSGGAQWDEALDAVLSGSVDIESAERSAREVVKNYYSTEKVAQGQARFLHSVHGGEAG